MGRHTTLDSVPWRELLVHWYETAIDGEDALRNLLLEEALDNLQEVRVPSYLHVDVTGTDHGQRSSMWVCFRLFAGKVDYEKGVVSHVYPPPSTTVMLALAMIPGVPERGEGKVSLQLSIDGFEIPSQGGRLCSLYPPERLVADFKHFLMYLQEFIQ